MKNASKRIAWTLSAVVAATLSSSAFSQQRVGSDGHALDANNRIGSNGLNEGSAGGPQVTGNQIVNRNVTGGRGFRGFVPYSDPTAFRGSLAGSGVDSFIRQSSGVPINGYNNFNAQSVQPFFGVSRFAPPPTGFTNSIPNVGYAANTPETRAVGDQRLGQVFDSPTFLQPQPGQLLMPGPVDAQQQPTVISASPLYGIRQWKPGDPADAAFLNDNTDFGSTTRRNAIDNASLNRMREDVQKNLLPENSTDPKNENPLSLDNPFDAPNNASMNAAPISAELGGNGPMSSSLSTGQGAHLKLLAAPTKESQAAARISDQQRELQDRFWKAQKDRMSEDQRANIEYNQARRAQAAAAEQAKKAGEPDVGKGPAGAPAGGGTAAIPDSIKKDTGTAPKPDKTDKTGEVLPGVTKATPKTGKSDKAPPLQIKSFATGVKSKELADVLQEAEDLMKAGRFSTALDKYDIAELVSKDNQMIKMGRANAELGASFYSRAEAHLREAMTNDPSLLMGQVDLRSMIGDDRLNYVVKDLKALAQEDKKSPRNVFLLAYVFYNTGDERKAAGYLDLAEQRAGMADPFFKLLRQNWSLPEGAAPIDEMNK